MTGDTLRPYATRYIVGRQRRGEITPRSARNLADRLEGLIADHGRRPLEQFGGKAVDRWLATTGHLSPATRRAYLSTCRGFCRWMAAEHIIVGDPTAHVPRIREPRRVPRALPAAAVALVLAAAPDLRARAMIWLMVGLGLRCGEVAGLEVGDYDPAAATVFVTGKGGHQRMVPVPPEAATAIDRYITAAGATAGPMIRSHTTGDHLQPHTVSRLVGRYMVDAGVKQRVRDGVSAHAFRHTCASDVLDRCPDLRVVQAMLGHVHLSSTAVYLRRANLGQMREAMSGRDYRPAA